MARKTSKSGHLQGGKFTRSHTTAIDAAIAPLRAAQELDSVTKISLGVIKQIGSGQKRLTFQEEGPTCLLAKVRGSATLQQVRIYTTDAKDIQAVKEVMMKTF